MLDQAASFSSKRQSNSLSELNLCTLTCSWFHEAEHRILVSVYMREYSIEYIPQNDLKATNVQPVKSCPCQFELRMLSLLENVLDERQIIKLLLLVWREATVNSDFKQLTWCDGASLLLCKLSCIHLVNIFFKPSFVHSRQPR